MGKKHVAIIGANKEALRLLPILLADSDTDLRIIADSNSDAMIFKLNELGYRLSPRLNIKTTSDLEDIKRDTYVNTIIDAVQDSSSSEFLSSPHFIEMDKFGPLSARLLWEVRASFEEGLEGGNKGAIFTSLREIVNSLCLITDRKELTSVILKLVVEFTGAQRASIMLVNEAENNLRVEAASGMDEEVIRKIRVTLGSGVSGYVAQKGKAVIISGKADPGEYIRPMDRNDAKSAMSVPLKVDNKVIGVINVSSSESPSLYSKEDLAFFSGFAALSSEVIYKSLEYEGIRSEAAKFSFWKEMEGMMPSDTPGEKDYTSIVKKIAGEVPGLTCLLYLYNEKTKSLILKASSTGGTGGLGLFGGIRQSHGIEGFAMDTKKDVFLVDRTEEDAEKKLYISLPMVCNDHFVGTLSGQVVSRNGLSKYHESFLKDIRSLVAQSVYRSMDTDRESRREKKISSIDDFGLDLITETDHLKLTRLIARKAADALAADGALLRLEQEDRRYQTAASYGLEESGLRQEFHYIEKETVLEVLRKNEPVSREFSEAASPGIKCVLSVPLHIDGEIKGVLTLFHRTYEETMYSGAFSDEDSNILQRFLLFAERALAVTIFRDPSAAGDDEKKTREPAPMDALEIKVDEELNRARRQDKQFILSTLRIVGPDSISQNKMKAVSTKFFNIINDETRNFDFVVRLSDDVFGLIYPQTGGDVTRVLEAVINAIKDTPLLNKSFLEENLQAYYGSAQFPADGDSFTALFAKAARRDIINLDRTFDHKVK
ncbi:MAG: GAF domain-containing protein [Thermodesulfobacteriota bacterium]